jgi:uncharacterized membrane protein YozB (DUF420 family)
MLDNRARVQYVDVILAFSSLVAFIAIAPWVYGAIEMAVDVLPPLSSTLIRLSLSIFVIGLIVSMGVSAKG